MRSSLYRYCAWYFCQRHRAPHLSGGVEAGPYRHRGARHFREEFSFFFSLVCLFLFVCLLFAGVLALTRVFVFAGMLVVIHLLVLIHVLVLIRVLVLVCVRFS